jgi:hypothetical protein
VKVHYPAATLLSEETLSFQETLNFRNRLLTEPVFINVFTDPYTFLAVIIKRTALMTIVFGLYSLQVSLCNFWMYLVFAQHMMQHVLQMTYV